MTHTSILSLTNLHNNNWDISGDPKRSLSRKIDLIIRLSHQNRKHIFTTILSTKLCWTLYKGVVLGFFLSLTAHYLSWNAMTIWETMEMIHSRSYTYIMKNVYSDPSEVFDTILDDDRILDRAKSVTASYDALINAAHQFDTGNMCARRLQRFSYCTVGD